MIKLKTLIELKSYLILYHGSDEKFDFVKANKRLAGVYMTTSEIVAHRYGKYIYVYKVLSNAKILDLGDGNDLLDFMIKNNIVDGEIDIDLENYILQGRLFQYDLSSKTRYMDYVVYAAENKGYDIVMVPDELKEDSDNIAYIVINVDVLQKI